MVQTIDREKTLVKEINRLKKEVDHLSAELEFARNGEKIVDNYFDLFDNIGISLMEMDVQELRKENNRLKEMGIDIKDYFLDQQNIIKHASLLKLLRVNKATIELFEAEDEEDFKTNILKTFTDKSLKKAIDRHIGFFNENSYFEGESIYQTLKGRELPILEKIYYPFEPNNIAVISLQDISKSKSLQSELQINKEKYRFLFEHSPVMIIEYDLSEVYKYYLSLNLQNLEEFKNLLADRSTGVLEEAFRSLKITDVNESGVKLLKAPNKQDILEHFDHYYTFNTFTAYLENIVLVFSGLLENTFETDLIASDGRHIDVLITWQIVTGHEKDFSKIFIIIVDISEQKALQKSLIDMQKLDSLGLLAGGIAHDLNNLLSPILGSVNLIQANDNLTNEVQNHLKRMEETTLKASELTRQLLTYSGKGKFITKVCNLNTILKKTKYLIDVSATKKVEVIYNLEERLPDIVADETQIQQVVMNLVSNGAAAMNYFGKLRIETKTETFSKNESDMLFKRFRLVEGEYIILKVTDEGTGIDESIRDKIFDPFFSTKENGRGLGLSVIHGIVITHNGGIRFDSVVGEGTTFTIVFPKYQLKIDKKSRKNGKTKSKDLEEVAKVLIVDDEPGVLEITSLLIKKLGYQVFEAKSGFDGLEILKREKIDILFTDLTMPGMDGVSLVKEVRKINKAIPIILMSGYNKHEIELQFSGFHISGFLQKPFSLDSIKEKLANNLQ